MTSTLTARTAALVSAAMLVTGCADADAEAPFDKVVATPTLAVSAVEPAALCATRGQVASADGHVHVAESTFRAFAPASGGDAAALAFTYEGTTDKAARLGSSQLRRQVGIKLRAQDGCNVVYVMWRVEPTPGIDVSVKRNPGKRNHEQCGNRGYTKIRPRRTARVPPLKAGASYLLRAEIVGDDLRVWIDDRPVWRGRLGAPARGISGPAGIRSDNVRLDIASFSAPAPSKFAAPPAACPKGDAADE